MEKQYQTKSNIPIYTYTNPNLHSFCLCLYLKAGLLYETNENNGITHLWEHMVFRNVDQLMNHTLYRRLDQYGLSFDGCTYREFVQFKISGAVKYFSDAVDIFLNIFKPMQITTSDFQIERKRIKAEIREEDEKSSLDFFTGKIIWQGTPLENSITGTPKTLDKIGIKALRNAHCTVLSVNNLFFYVTGNVDEPCIQQLAERLESIPIAITSAERLNQAFVPPNFFHRDCRVDVKNCTYTYIRFSFDFDAERYTQAELDLLYSILFEGDTCKIFRELSDNTGYIYSFDARQEKYCNIGNLYFSFEVQYGNLMDSIDKVIRILTEMKNCQQEELDYAKTPYIDNADFMLDDDEDLNWNMAYENHIMNSRFLSIEQRKLAYDAVEPARISEISREIFKPENLVVTVKGDQKKIETDSIRNILLLL